MNWLFNLLIFVILPCWRQFLCWMWIGIYRMRIRIHKIWSMLIQDNKITDLISNHILKVNNRIFWNLYLNLLDKLLFYNFLPKNTKNMLVKLCFSLHFIPLGTDPDHQTQMNKDPTGSGSTSLLITLIYPGFTFLRGGGLAVVRGWLHQHAGEVLQVLSAHPWTHSTGYRWDLL